MCMIEGCERVEQLRRGMCKKHYTRWRTHGDAGLTSVCPADATPEERLRFHGWSVTDSGCWEWGGRRLDRDGYGRVTVRGAGVRVHRLAYETWVGPIPAGRVLRHTCDNPPCINPEHLLVGTVSDNTQDMLQRGRFTPPRGEKNGNSRLTARQVLRIRNCRSKRVGEVAEEFGIARSTVYSIWNGSRWAQLRGEAAHD